MDMYYNLKDKLKCPDCNYDLKHSNDMIAICILCGKTYKINLEVKEIKNDGLE